MKFYKVSAYFDSLAIGHDGIISLRDSDLAVIIRKGNSNDVIGQTAISKEFQTLLDAGCTSGTYIAVSKVDHIERIYSFIKLQPFGQYLHVGLGYHEVFAPWRKELYKTIGFVLLLIILIGLWTRMTYKAWHRQQLADKEKEQMIVKLERSLEEVNILSGLIPICSNCKKIRDDNGYWNQIEAYISSHSSAQFSHGICPDCAKLLYADLIEENDELQPK